MSRLFALLPLFVLGNLFFLGGSLLWTPKTALASEEKVVFFAFGDQGTGGTVQKTVANSLEQKAQEDPDVDFVLLLGDNFYPDGVTSTTDPQWQEIFEQVYSGPTLLKLPFLALLGNHDYNYKYTGDPQAQVDYAKKIGRWQMDGFYYFRDFASHGETLLRLIMLDTNEDDPSTGKQIDFLKDALNQSNKKPLWTLVAGHHPIRSIGRHGPKSDLYDWLLPLLKEYRVDAYLSGHEHNQQIIQLPDEPLHIISGGGGKTLRGFKRQSPWVKYAARSFGFMKLTLSAKQLDLNVFDENGQQTFTMQLEK